MFVPDAHVQPAADPRMKFEKVEEQQMLFQLVTSNPFLMQSPNAPLLMRAVTEDLLRAHGAEKLIPLMPQPPGPPPPPEAHPPFEEEAGWLRDQDAPPHPDDNDDEHIQNHTMFAQSPTGGALSKTGREMMERHIRHHIAQGYEKRARGPMQPSPMGMGPGGPPPGPQQGPPPGMAPGMPPQ